MLKRRIVSLLLTLIMAMSFIPSAYAEESGDVFEISHLYTAASGEDYYAMVTVRNLTSHTQNGVLVISSYSSDGVFSDFTYTNISLPANGGNAFVAKFNSVPTTFQKVFVWDGFGTFTPLAKPLSVQFPDSIDIDSKEYSYQATLADEQQFHYDNTYIKFGNREYKFANSVDVYVNGALYTTISAETDTDTSLTISQARLDAILSQAQGKIKIVRTDPDNFNFTEIHANCYQIATVHSIHKNSFSTKIEFANIKGCIDSNAEASTWDYILIDHDAVKSGEVIVNVTRDGEPSDLLSICGDVIAYAVDFKNEEDLVNPKKIDIIAVSDNLVPCTVTAINKNSPYTSYDDVYTLSGTDYTIVDYYLFHTDPPLKIDDLLYITPDPFGRIYSYEYNTAPVQYGIALTSDMENNNIKILSSEGNVKTYQVDTASARNFTTDFVTDKIDDETNVENRVVSYVYSTISSKIVKINKLTADKNVVGVEYNSRTSLLGSGNKILPNTPILCVDEDCEGTTLTSNSSSYSVLEKKDLIDDVKYTGHIYKVGTDVAFVVLTNIGITTTFHADSRFAVAISEPAQILTEEGDRAWSIDVLYEGRVKTLILTSAAKAEISNVKDGCAFFFETDSDEYVKDIIKVEDLENETSKYDAYDWSFDIWDGRTPYQLSKGVVVEVDDETIAFASPAQIATGTLDTTAKLTSANQDGLVYYAVDDVCEVYTLDKTVKSTKLEELFNVDYPSSIKVSNFSIFEVDGAEGKYDSTGKAESLDDRATYAWALIVEGEVVEIFAIEK